MKKLFQAFSLPAICLWLLLCSSCKETTKNTSVSLQDIPLNRGDIIACGPADKAFGTVGSIASCSPATQKDFELGMALLHSFEYGEAEKMFAKVIDADPSCAMAYWGVAMSNYHPLWEPPTPEELEKGSKIIALAQALPHEQPLVADYIHAMAQFYADKETKDHRSRSIAYSKAMEKMYAANRDNKEVAILYALSLVATAEPTDKTFVNQKKAGELLTGLYPGNPDHPGIVHYIIHAYDYPELAHLALPSARKYAAIAPSSAHAQHMPSHIFTRLGLWDESIQSNKVATSSAKCYAETAGLDGHWDEELHGLDYLEYAYLQTGDNTNAKALLDYLYGFKKVTPFNFKVAYAFTAIPSRYYLENRMWKEAAALQLYPADAPWEKFPWQEAMFHFTRLMGSVQLNQPGSAKKELAFIKAIHDTLLQQKDAYKASQVMIQLKTGEAWILLKEGKQAEALQLMKEAAGLEDQTGKHPVTPGEVLPARELLGDMLMQLDQPKEALAAYEKALQKQPNRFNGLYSAATAAEKAKEPKKAVGYYQQLVTMAGSKGSTRPELETAKLFLKSQPLLAHQ